MISRSEQVRTAPVREREWHVVCRSEDIPKGQMRPFKAGNRRIVVVRLQDGTLRSVANTCPHEAAKMSDGTVERMWQGDSVGEHRRDERCVIICPWHNFEFDLDTGESPCEPERLKLKTYRVGEMDGDIYVHV